MKKTHLIAVIIVILLCIGGVFILKNDTNEPITSTGNSNIENRTHSFNDAGVRISLDVPFGWQTGTADYQYNTVPGGGSIKAIELSPENLDNTGLPSDTNVSIYSYNFNPEAALADVIPLVIGSGTIIDRSELVKIDGRDLRHIIITGQSNPTIDTETPAYQRELYIGRFKDGQIFEMNIGYQNNESYKRYVYNVSSILEKLRWND